MIIRTFSRYVRPQEWTRFGSGRNSNTYVRGRSKNRLAMQGRQDLSPTVKGFRSRWSAFHPELSSYRIIWWYFIRAPTLGSRTQFEGDSLRLNLGYSITSGLCSGV